MRPRDRRHSVIDREFALDQLADFATRKPERISARSASKSSQPIRSDPQNLSNARDRGLSPRSQVNFGRRYTAVVRIRSEEHTSELQSLMRISYAVFCLKNNNSVDTTPNAKLTT